MLDLKIVNGHLLDPASGLDQKGDIGIQAGKITFNTSTPSKETVDASGSYVFPGLIDYHVHLFQKHTENGIYSGSLFASGVTSAVDPGSAGCDNYDIFHDGVIDRSALTIKAFLNVCSEGLPGYGHWERPVKENINKDAIKKLVDKYPDEILGLKIRINKECLSGDELYLLQDAKDLASELGLPLCVHTTDSPLKTEDIVSVLGCGDIYCHVYQGKNESAIVDQSGALKNAIVDASSKGVILDAANGRNHFAFNVAKKAISEGIFPDLITTDAIRSTLYTHPTVLDLPHIMSKYYALGIPLENIIKAVTSTPAGLMHESDNIGALREGMNADICIMRLAHDTDTIFTDSFGETLSSNCAFKVIACIKEGQVLFSDSSIISSKLSM